ncbi:hypothetical protein M2103_001014 [Ereboglobus sp. PH5-5]|uniref:DUF6794 domain-containing protein n=1 Tax=unclassified Ereboglobus TaxID=2626932 RepID=UPI00240770DE|nr:MULTISPECIES: DUF6794 domain-containing protein [unclassified Ereboglobus]MDF9827664.1 hypothetical protein [Ereboglobus sp. PH5-10]MDF9832800.1 hypothetical protein [Ereboglobus sp. PH5-5]
MKLLKWLCLFLFIACHAEAEAPVKSWTHVPEDKYDYPWRVLLLPNGKIESQTLFDGIRRSDIYKARINKKYIKFKTNSGIVVKLSKKEGELVFQNKLAGKEYVFRPSAEWDCRFDKALPIPKTETEAISTLRKIMSSDEIEQIRSMKKDDLIRLHFGWGMWIRNAFGFLGGRKSALLKDLGGGHPDHASGKLLLAFWEDLQKDKKTDSAAPVDSETNTNKRSDKDG